MSIFMKKQKTPRGYFIMLVLVFGAVFLTLISALSGYIFVEKRAQLAKENREKALHMAEMGLEYYRWFLAHNPDDTMNGTGMPGPYVREVSDPEGGAIGSYSLDVAGETYCGEISRITITSTGWTYADPQFTRTVSATYVRPSVAEFSHIVDANVWAGSDRVISGPYHSNQGIRMDGTHNATVSSGVADWLCTSSFGCSPSQTQNGVFGGGGPQALWEFPAAPVDFNGITVDLAQLEGFATTSGIFLGDSGNYGYEVEFRNDGSMDVRTVTGTQSVWGYSIADGWELERSVVTATGATTNYPIPNDCPVVFIEDDIWLEGVVSGQVVLAAADVGGGSVDRSIILSGDITYANADGDGLTAIGEENVLIGLEVPNTMNINGVFIAQKGRFSRNHYSTAYLPSSLDQYVTRDTLNTTGTVVSKNRVGTKWSSGGTFVSGFSQRNDSFDNNLADNPPPFTPRTSDDYSFRLWQEVE